MFYNLIIKKFIVILLLFFFLNINSIKYEIYYMMYKIIKKISYL